MTGSIYSHAIRGQDEAAAVVELAKPNKVTSPADRWLLLPRRYPLDRYILTQPAHPGPLERRQIGYPLSLLCLAGNIQHGGIRPHQPQHRLPLLGFHRCQDLRCFALAHNAGYGFLIGRHILQPDRFLWLRHRPDR